MLYKYKEALSLRDEIGTCPNIEVGIEVTDKSPFFIRPYHIREEDKRVIDKEIKCLFYLGVLKEGFSAYSCPVMLIMLYNILLLINHYIGSIAINAMTKTMNNIGIPHAYFIRSLGHCISP